MKKMCATFRDEFWMNATCAAKRRPKICMPNAFFLPVYALEK
jgi:hypothetical protein